MSRPVQTNSASATLPPAPPAQTSTQQSGGSTSSTVTAPGGYRLPENTTMQHALKLAIVEDKPIMLDYWTSSLDKTVLIGVKENQEKLLVKSEEEYTSPIAKIYKVGTEYIIVTENSIYLVDVNIPTKRISA